MWRAPGRALPAWLRWCRVRAWCVAAIRQQPRQHAGLPQQPLHPAVGRQLGAAGAAGDAVEVVAGLDHPDQELPPRPVVARVALAHREVGSQDVPALLQRRLQLGRNRAVVGRRVALRRETPAEYRRRERPRVGQPRLGLAVGTEPPLGHARPPPLPLGVARQHRPRPHMAGADTTRPVGRTKPIHSSGRRSAGRISASVTSRRSRSSSSPASATSRSPS